MQVRGDEVWQTALVWTLASAQGRHIAEVSVG
ncbi:hypothetical protein BH24ACT7_BH24ACT7_26190 [soil metagenome]